jgi:hypothetical protein
MRDVVPVAVAVLGLTVLTYLQFPGYTWLQSDTQIYLPIFEHQRDPSLLAKDLVAIRAHVTYTMYDEVALWLRALTRLGFREVLLAQQAVFRVLGLFGVYLIAGAAGLRRDLRHLVVACFALGATIGGPAVLTMEYEPVPRCFAVLLLLLAVGLAAYERYSLAGAAGALALLYHPPTSAPFWAVAVIWALATGLGKRRAPLFVALLAGAAALATFIAFQQGPRDGQELTTRIDPWLADLQQMRASYNWLSLWPTHWLWQYPFLAVVTAAAWWRLRSALRPNLRWFSLGMVVYGVLSLAASYLTLEHLRWSLIPQFQPARAVLFIVAFAVILCAAAGLRAAQAGRWWEAVAWFFVVYAVPANARVLQLLSTDLAQPLVARRLGIVLLLAALATLAGWLASRERSYSYASWAAALLLPFFLIPGWGEVRNYPALHTPEIAELSEWARNNTRTDAVVLFADSGKDLAPGIFRAQALRTVYVDWKGGGQVNLLRSFAADWWYRWRSAHPEHFEPTHLPRYRAMGIDYLILQPKNRPPGMQPLFANRKYEVFALP